MDVEEPGLVCCGVGSATLVFGTRWHGKSDLILSSPGDLPLHTALSIKFRTSEGN